MPFGHDEQLVDDAGLMYVPAVHWDMDKSSDDNKNETKANL
jgi:hypothetical protein